MAVVTVKLYDGSSGTESEVPIERDLGNLLGGEYDAELARAESSNTWVKGGSGKARRRRVMLNTSIRGTQYVNGADLTDLENKARSATSIFILVNDKPTWEIVVSGLSGISVGNRNAKGWFRVGLEFIVSKINWVETLTTDAGTILTDDSGNAIAAIMEEGI